MTNGKKTSFFYFCPCVSVKKLAWNRVSNLKKSADQDGEKNYGEKTSERLLARNIITSLFIPC